MSDNPNAFPFPAEYGHPAACGGMTLRDYFAGQVLAGLSAIDAGGVASILQVAREMDREATEVIASICFERADAMLAKRAKVGEA